MSEPVTRYDVFTQPVETKDGAWVIAEAYDALATELEQVQLNNMALQGMAAARADAMDELKQQLAQAQQQATALRWTDAKPTQAGHYWFRGYPAEPSEDWCLYDVVEEEGILMIDYNEQPIKDKVKLWPQCQWAGPLARPEQG